MRKYSGASILIEKIQKLKQLNEYLLNLDIKIIYKILIFPFFLVSSKESIQLSWILCNGWKKLFIEVEIAEKNTCISKSHWCIPSASQLRLLYDLVMHWVYPFRYEITLVKRKLYISKSKLVYKLFLDVHHFRYEKYVSEKNF